MWCYTLFFKSQYPYFLIAAAVIGVCSLAIPVFGDLVVKGWYKIAEVLGAINGKILLSLVFFVVLFPVAVIAKLTKKNPLHLKKEDTDSVFTERNPQILGEGSGAGLVMPENGIFKCKKGLVSGLFFAACAFVEQLEHTIFQAQIGHVNYVCARPAHGGSIDVARRYDYVRTVGVELQFVNAVSE